MRAYRRPPVWTFPRDLLLQLLTHDVKLAKEALTTEQCKSERLVTAASAASELHCATEANLAKAHAAIEELKSARTQADKVGAWSMRAPGRGLTRFACVVQDARTALSALGSSHAKEAVEQNQQISALQQQVGRRL